MPALEDTINYLNTDYASLIGPLRDTMAGGVVSPVVQEQYAQAENVMQENLARKLGPDWMETTPGQKLYTQLQTQKQIAYDTSALQNQQASYQNYSALVAPMVHAAETQASLETSRANVSAQVQGAKDVANIQGEYDIQKQQIASEAAKYGYDQSRASALEVAQLNADVKLKEIQSDFDIKKYTIDQTIETNRYIAELDAKTKLDLQQMENDFGIWKANFDRETDYTKLNMLKDLSETQSKYALGTVLGGKTLEWFLGSDVTGTGTPGYQIIGDILTGKTTVSEALSKTAPGQAYDYLSGLFSGGDVAASVDTGMTYGAQQLLANDPTLYGDLLTYTPELAYGIGSTAGALTAGEVAIQTGAPATLGSAYGAISGTGAGAEGALAGGAAGVGGAAIGGAVGAAATISYWGPPTVGKLGRWMGENIFGMGGGSTASSADFMNAILTGQKPGTAIGNQSMPDLDKMNTEQKTQFIASMLGGQSKWDFKKDSSGKTLIDYVENKDYQKLLDIGYLMVYDPAEHGGYDTPLQAVASYNGKKVIISPYFDRSKWVYQQESEPYLGYGAP